MDDLGGFSPYFWFNTHIFGHKQNFSRKQIPRSRVGTIDPRIERGTLGRPRHSVAWIMATCDRFNGKKKQQQFEDSGVDSIFFFRVKLKKTVVFSFF